MIRLIGILLGSAIAVALLILVVGIPRITDGPAPQPVDVSLPLLPEPVAMDHATPALPAEIVAALSDAPPTQPEPPVSPAPAPEPVPDPLPELPFETAATTEEPRWYAFWSPFRSRIAANGFVTQLQRVTALDYRVVSIKPGVYEVAFAYNEDAEIQANLSQITAATGLEVPGT